MDIGYLLLGAWDWCIDKSIVDGYCLPGEQDQNIDKGIIDGGEAC